MRAPRIRARHILPFSIALMWTGLFWSRALLSVGMGMMILSSIATTGFIRPWQMIRTSTYLKGYILLFAIPLFSLIWSEDLRWWLKVMQDKLPLLALPFCCLAIREIEAGTRRKLIVFALAVLAASMVKSTGSYLLNHQEVAEAYLKAKVMSVDMHGDHVRYGWLLSLIFSWLLFAVTEYRSALSRIAFRGLTALTVGLAVYLHLLASKTGLMGLYLSLAIWAWSYRGIKMVRWMTASTLLLPVLAWLLLPTFRNRLKFILWDFQHYTRGGYTEGLSDTPRVLSLEAGRDLLSGHPWLGTGFGDLRNEMNGWYLEHASFIKEYEQLLPSNEFLLHGAAAGIPLAILFSVVVLLPFRLPSHRKSMAWISFHAIAVAGFMYEIGLETQYGIFIYAFLGCWVWLFMGNPGNPGWINDLKKKESEAS
jgi:O-antigen ligase